MSVAREEIFGPVVSILSFEDADEALRLANDTDYGLAATVWSKDIDVALRTARGIRARNGGDQRIQRGRHQHSFGGYKMSGFGGRDYGLEAPRAVHPTENDLDHTALTTPCQF
jgi:gamma-glutamyl-gamma-aminobutyraldehyde dehydrogenase